jgi:hypothetical protein
MVCARSLFLFAVIETAPPEEGVWYGGPEQPKVNGVVGDRRYAPAGAAKMAATGQGPIATTLCRPR